MTKHYLSAALFSLAIATLPSSLQAQPIANKAVQIFRDVHTVQYAGPERCHWLRRHARELEYRIAYAPPWDQGRLHSRLAEIRHQLWEHCRW